MFPRFERDIRIERDPSRPISGRDYVRAQRAKRRPKPKTIFEVAAITTSKKLRSMGGKGYAIIHGVGEGVRNQAIPRGQHEFQKKIKRATAVAGTAVVVGAAGVIGVQQAQTRLAGGEGQRPAGVETTHNPQDIFLTLEDGKLVPSPDNKPVPVRAQFIAPTSENNTIVFHSKPKVYDPLDRDNETIRVPQGSIKTQHVVRVAGSTFEGGPQDAYRGRFTIPQRALPVGQWGYLSDEAGNFVKPNGQLLKQGEKPYYTEAYNFTVPETQPTQVTVVEADIPLREGVQIRKMLPNGDEVPFEAHSKYSANSKIVNPEVVDTGKRVYLAFNMDDKDNNPQRAHIVIDTSKEQFLKITRAPEVKASVQKDGTLKTRDGRTITGSSVQPILSVKPT